MDDTLARLLGIAGWAWEWQAFTRLAYEISLPARIPPESLSEMAKEPPGVSRISIR